MQADEAHLETLIRAGDLAALEEAAAIVAGFPEGADSWGQSWIGLAAAVGPRRVVEWMLARGVPLARREGQLDPVLHAVIDRSDAERHDILSLVIAAGAPLEERGINDWSALHLAAMRDDFAALDILLAAGADRAARTNCDDYATPEEEARQLGHGTAADFLRDWRPGLDRKGR